MSGIYIVPFEYQCRVCATRGTLHISPIERTVEGEDVLLIDADGYHRVITARCEGCGIDRPHVMLPEAEQ